MPDTDEIDHRLLVVAPYEGIDIGVKSLCEVFLLASG